MLHIYRFESVPQNTDGMLFLDAVCAAQFIIYHDLGRQETYIITQDEGLKMALENALPGMLLERSALMMPHFARPLYMVPFAAGEGCDEGEAVQALRDIYRANNWPGERLMVTFTPSDIKHVRAAKERAEELISSIDIRMTQSTGRERGADVTSAQRDLYYGSDKRHLLLAMLDMFNKTIASNGTSYKMGIIADRANVRSMHYIGSRLRILDTTPISLKADELFGFLKSADAVPLPYSAAGAFLEFSPSIARARAVHTRPPSFNDSEGLGEYLEDALRQSGKGISIEPNTLNLGTLITGVPGTGKTYAAMSLVAEALRQKGRVAVISPTEEWNAFGISSGMAIVRLGQNSPNINFFKCDSEIGIEKFYENLAMLIASASGAGPYRDPMEKGLLAAFKRSYRKTRSPDPAEVYTEIESTIIEQHAHRSSTGVKYTKHGENIMAALEVLRQVLMNAQFAYSEGIDFSELLVKGVIFDLSGISNSMKPFVYALLLNQLYSLADAMDTEGDSMLRMLLCMEEAQLVFGAERGSAAAEDLKQRIQDFRKKGVGLMLITHSTSEIDLGIRRLCQTKFYFRQSPDSVRYAAADLMFDDDDEVKDNLKRLGQRVCAVNYMQADRDMPAEPLFMKVRISEYKGEAVPSGQRNCPNAFTRIRIVNAEGKPVARARVELSYLGERMHKGMSDDNGIVETDAPLPRRRLTLRIFGEKKKDTRAFEIEGGTSSHIVV